MEEDAWKEQPGALGEFIRSQRKLANYSLRQLAAVSKVSNAYLSQVERGLHEPSARVLKSIAHALDIQTETLLAQAGFLTPDPAGAEADIDGHAAGGDARTEAAIRNDPNLSDEQKAALISVYRSYREGKPSADKPQKPQPPKGRST